MNIIPDQASYAVIVCRDCGKQFPMQMELASREAAGTYLVRLPALPVYCKTCAEKEVK